MTTAPNVYENQNKIMRVPEIADVTFEENEFSTKFGMISENYTSTIADRTIIIE